MQQENNCLLLFFEEWLFFVHSFTCCYLKIKIFVGFWREENLHNLQGRRTAPRAGLVQKFRPSSGFRPVEKENIWRGNSQEEEINSHDDTDYGIDYLAFFIGRRLEPVLHLGDIQFFPGVVVNHGQEIGQKLQEGGNNEREKEERRLRGSSHHSEDYRLTGQEGQDEEDRTVVVASDKEQLDQEEQPVEHEVDF